MTPILGIMASGISGNLWAPGKDYDSIATVTVGGGGSASITFSSIPSTYRHLQIRCLTLGAGSQIGLRMNSDSGSNYAYHQVSGNGASTFATSAASQTIILNNFNTATSATYPLVLVIDILDYANTSKYKTSRNLAGIDQNGSGTVQLSSGLWMNTTAVSTLTLTDSGGNIAQYSQFALYGIK
jgi:hypothetical protein